LKTLEETKIRRCAWEKYAYGVSYIS
jgi:hypothetical protein